MLPQTRMSARPGEPFGPHPLPPSDAGCIEPVGGRTRQELR
jgi:hypothetical protein